MDEPRPTVKAEYFFGAIQAGAREHETTAQIWDRIRSLAEQEQISIPGDMFSQVNHMRSVASGLTNASEAFGAAPDNAALEGSMIGTQLYQRSSADLLEIAAKYHVRFQMTTVSALGSSTGWYTFDYGGTLPSTKGELLADVEAYGQGLTEGYSVEFDSIGDIEIGAY